MRLLAVALLAALIAGCAPTLAGSSAELTADASVNRRESHGVVLMSVDWGRRWGFCGFENVQLSTFAFDRMPVEKHDDLVPGDLIVGAPPSLLAGPGTVAHYALLVHPGEYALISSQFTGDLVYIRHFGLECVDGQPTIWRYYVEGRAGFQHYLDSRVKPRYPFLDTEKAQYRLFRTSRIGRDYELR